MAFFKDILSKLGIKGKAAAAAPAATTAAKPAVRPVVKPGAPASRSVTEILNDVSSAAGPVKPAAMDMVDVEAKLNGLAKANPEKLDWKVSIVDLLKLLGIDSSLTSRKELAKELGCPADLMGDSAKMNVWLHKTVLARIAANGGKVPANLLD